MAKPLRHRLKYWKQLEREPDDVSHHFRGRDCITECQLFVSASRRDVELLRAIVYEWLQRNPGIRPIVELATALDIHDTPALLRALRALQSMQRITLSTDYDMLSDTWLSAGISVNDWLRYTAFEQSEGAPCAR